MKIIHSRSFVRWIGMGLLAISVMLGLLLTSTMAALASSVSLYDQAGVLNASQVRSAASSLPYPISIYTTNYSGSNSQFDQQTRSKVRSNNMIVLAINTRGHVYIDGGTKVPLNNDQYTSASQAIASNYGSNRDFTSATIAAIQSLNSTLNSANSGGGLQPGVRGGLGGFGAGSTLCCIGLLVLACLAVFAVMRLRRRAGGLFNRPNGGGYGPYNQPYQGNYPPGGYPPGNYPPNYGPGYPPRQGMSPWGAGGLGAAAGGFLGYELGKDQGEREAREEQGNYGEGGGFGGDAGGGADFGGDSGGGADFGGGGFGGDSGGGADFGGGDNGGMDSGGGGSNF